MMEIGLVAALAGILILAGLRWRARITRNARQREWDLLSQGCPDVLWHLDMKKGTFTATDRVWDWADRVPGGVQELFDRRKEFFQPEEWEVICHAALPFSQGESTVLDLEFRMTLPGRQERWYRVRGRREDSPRSLRMAGSWSDVTEIKALGVRLWEWAHVDPLTGLGNRLQVFETLETLTNPYCVLLVDVDHFSAVNHTHRQSGGDTALRALARILKSLFRSDDLVVRWGGDEFVVVVSGDLTLAQTLAKRIHETLKIPVIMDPLPCVLSASIGIAPCPEGNHDHQALLVQAEQALRQAQLAGGNQSVVFHKQIGAQADRRTLLERKLAQVIRNGGLRLVFQPQFHLSSRRLTGFEALSRWEDSDLGPISPAEFIPMAEDLGLISALGTWALTEACDFLRRHRSGPAEHLTMAVNVSVMQLREDSFVHQVEQIVQEAGLPPSSIELEITESILVQSFESTVAKLDLLRTKGFRIALDDFGKGYSSLSYLKILPLDTLKIDKDFLRDGTQEALLGTIIRLGCLLNLQVVAEGIEAEEQLEILLESGCHKVQGFFFSRPLEAGEAADLLDRR